MERLNGAAVTKIGSLIGSYHNALVDDISQAYGIEDLKAHADDLLLTFFLKKDEAARRITCSWFTKRGEPCNKERKHGSNFCSVHTEYLLLHDEEISRARTCPSNVNVTRKGMHKA
jgi:hypothetical protein